MDTPTVDTDTLRQQYRLNYWTLNEYQLVGYGESEEAALLQLDQATIVHQLGYTPEA